MGKKLWCTGSALTTSTCEAQSPLPMSRRLRLAPLRAETPRTREEEGTLNEEECLDPKSLEIQKPLALVLESMASCFAHCWGPGAHIETTSAPKCASMISSWADLWEDTGICNMPAPGSIGALRSIGCRHLSGGPP